MIPSVITRQASLAGKTLVLADVTGGEKPGLSNQVTIDNQAFREVLLGTMERAGFLAPTRKGEPADYELHADIAGQRSLQTGSLAITSHLLVSYRLVERSTKKDVWKEAIYSRYQAEGKTYAEELQKAKQEAVEGAVRENLGQLIQRIQTAVTPR
jgi:hypothetical protein